MVKFRVIFANLRLKLYLHWLSSDPDTNTISRYLRIYKHHKCVCPSVTLLDIVTDGRPASHATVAARVTRVPRKPAAN